jgi:penicillin G amidase
VFRATPDGRANSGWGGYGDLAVITWLVAVAIGTPQRPAFERTEYGVPLINASSWQEAFLSAGVAAATDRMWQMETSRRAARGRLAEVLGDSFAAGDREHLKFGYTDEELQRQIDALPPKIRQAFTAYAAGVNAYLSGAKANNTLPPGYAQYKFEPEPWTTLDSAAISVKFLQTFGRGGAGEIRNLALLNYLGTLPIKDRALDVFDDMIWTNVPSATVTLKGTDDPMAKNPPKFPRATRAELQKHIAALPKLGLMELLPGVRVAQRESSRLVAERVAAPYKSGSYAIVVGGSRSNTGKPILLSAPQMGFRAPSIVTEVSMRAPGLNVTGMSVPGVPGVMIGMTDRVAWGMTTGVADTEDIVFVRKAGANQYVQNGKTLDVEVTTRTLKIAGKNDETVVRRQTDDGPVIIDSNGGGVLLVRKSSFFKRELESFGALYGIYEARDANDLIKSIDSSTVNFNFFFATTAGETGYAYTGLIPKRNPGWDPRLPIPAEAAWTSYLPRTQMPHSINPKSGLLANWNNKPTAWWDNGDTPAWGEIFRDHVLRDALAKPTLSVSDVETAAWKIARTDDSFWAFQPFLAKSGDPLLAGYDGMRLDGSLAQDAYGKWLDNLRRELFQKPLNGLMTPDFFRQAVQPSLILRALQGKTKFDYLAGRKADAVVRAALPKEVKPHVAGSVNFAGQPRIVYGDRGTYIQVVEFFPSLRGRNVMPPGQAESGPHQNDQIPLAQQWLFKPMRFAGP